MDIQHFYNSDTGTLSYVVFDRDSKDAIVIDPVLDFNLENWRVSMTAIEEIEHFIHNNKLKARWILDTHVHADHITGASRLKQKLDCPYAIGSKVIARTTQKAYRKNYSSHLINLLVY